MSKESMLQRQFKEKDVQRMRNIIQKKYGDKTTTQIGYTKINKEYQEGDVWEENGRKWTIKNGIKQNISKLDKLKHLTSLPLVCPNCNKPMKNNKQNKQMFSLHKKCFDCVIKYETELKRVGEYDKYERNIVINGLKAHIKELEDIMLDLSVNESNESFITEAGDIETWKGNNNHINIIKKELENYITKLKDITEN